MRKLASIQTISELRPIEDANKIELAIIGGWQAVVKKNQFQVGQLVTYIEIDSWVPTTLAPFLSKGEPREYQGIKGEKLRTIRLKKVLSQGLILPLSVLGEVKEIDGKLFIETTD
jgi:RNA ligase (TIGR02306 family)